MANITVDVIINGKPLTTYPHKGDVFIEGRKNSNYQIRIRNNDYKRIKVVVSVDGLSVMDGEPASESSTGYLINGLETFILEGWRVDQNNIRKFLFGDNKDSFSNKTGQGTNNTGVIGVMAFDEAYVTHGLLVSNLYHQYDQYKWSDQTSAFPPTMIRSFNSMNATAVGAATSTLNAMGTGMGEEVKSPVHNVKFVAQPRPSRTVVIYYDDKRGLEARGIVVDTRQLKPDPFPGSSSYCKRV